MGNHALLHPFAPPAKPESEMINIVRAEGSTLYDDQGNSYIDGLASLWYCQIGHSRPEMADAVAEQMRELAAYNTFDPFTNPPAARAAEMVAERSPLTDGRVFFGCTGSDAVDTALKLARLFAQRTSGRERQVVIRRTNGYHGTNFGGTSAQGIEPNREGWGDLVPHFIEVPNDDIEVMATAFAEHGERVAAVITEPVQGAGGVFPPPDGYLAGVRRLCDQHGALLILDEVIDRFRGPGLRRFRQPSTEPDRDLVLSAIPIYPHHQPSDAMEHRIEQILDQLTREEKATLTAGETLWNIGGVDRVGHGRVVRR